MKKVTKITRADVDGAWQKFMRYTETAEQHEFPLLAIIQLKIEPLYKDLLENWDDHHAEVFMKGMKLMVFDRLGISEN